MNHYWQQPPTGRFDKIDHCNLFIPFGFPGYAKMLSASQGGRLNHYRTDPARHGIYVNLREYFDLCGERKISGFR